MVITLFLSLSFEYITLDNIDCEEVLVNGLSHVKSEMREEWGHWL